MNPMADVIKTTKFDDAKTVRNFARLMGIANKCDADILLDPLPHLSRASGELYRLRRALEAAYWALSGTEVSYNPMAMDYESIESKLLKRNRKAMEILRSAREAGDKAP